MDITKGYHKATISFQDAMSMVVMHLCNVIQKQTNAGVLIVIMLKYQTVEDKDKLHVNQEVRKQ